MREETPSPDATPNATPKASPTAARKSRGGGGVAHAGPPLSVSSFSRQSSSESLLLLHSEGSGTNWFPENWSTSPTASRREPGGGGDDDGAKQRSRRSRTGSTDW